MDTLQEHNNEVQDNLMKLWDEKKETLGLGEYSDEIALHIENQNTELLKKIAKGEIERIKGKIKEYEELYKQYSDTYTNILKDELTHWQQVLEDLEK